MPSSAAAVFTANGWQYARPPVQPALGRIDLWLLAGADHFRDREALLNSLSPHERQRAERKKIAAKQFEYILGQAALRYLLAQHLCISSHAVRYVQGHKGKPKLDPLHQRPDLHFNISHSCGLILIAISTIAEIGVDIEGLNDNTSIDLVSRRAFSARECLDLQKQPEDVRREQFFQLWTCKEAVVKCSGDGIHSGMSQFTVIFPASDRATISSAIGTQSKTHEYSIATLPLGDQHKGALVSHTKICNLHRHYLAQWLSAMA